MQMNKTGFCYGCGLSCEDLFCNKKCESKYKRMKQADVRLQVKEGKRKGYGIKGSTH